MNETRVGKLLIANPMMDETNPFSKSVIYIYQDSKTNGSVGVILNKPTRTKVQHLCLDQGVGFPYSRPVVYNGGPVNASAMVLLHSDEWQSSNTAFAGRNYAVTSDQVMLHKLAQDDAPVYWRLCMGISAWAPGQLDMEIAGQFPYNVANQWLTATANDDIMFNYDGEKQWRKALEICSQEVINQFF